MVAQSFDTPSHWMLIFATALAGRITALFDKAKYFDVDGFNRRAF